MLELVRGRSVLQDLPFGNSLAAASLAFEMQVCQPILSATPNLAGSLEHPIP